MRAPVQRSPAVHFSSDADAARVPSHTSSENDQKRLAEVLEVRVSARIVRLVRAANFRTVRGPGGRSDATTPPSPPVAPPVICFAHKYEAAPVCAADDERLQVGQLPLSLPLDEHRVAIELRLT